MTNFMNETDLSQEIPSLEIFNGKLKIISRFFYLSSKEFHYKTPQANESD